MNFITFLVSLGLIAAVCSNPISKCPAHCEATEHFHMPDFRHVSDLQDSSVAPWRIVEESEEGREPYSIENAVCQGGCKIHNMEPKPIFLEIWVSHLLPDNSTCKCPYELAVGCTCVNKTTATE